MLENVGIKNALLSLKMMVNDGIKKEQSIKLLLVIVKKTALLCTPHNIILAHDFIYPKEDS